MADRKLEPPIEGETRFGGERPGIRGVFYIPSAGKAGGGSVFALDSVDVQNTVLTHYLFFSSDGKLRTATAFPTNTESDGTIVGSQS